MLAVPVARLPVAEVVQQLSQFRVAAVHVADDVERTAGVRAVGPGPLADKLHGIDAFLCANDTMALGVLDALDGLTSLGGPRSELVFDALVPFWVIDLLV
jgi:DNA-binding LacI/PurR family transcriptional regulator